MRTASGSGFRLKLRRDQRVLLRQAARRSGLSPERLLRELVAEGLKVLANGACDPAPAPPPPRPELVRRAPTAPQPEVIWSGRKDDPSLIGERPSKSA